MCQTDRIHRIAFRSANHFRSYVALAAMPVLFLGAVISSAYLKIDACSSILAWCAICALLATLLRIQAKFWIPLIVTAGTADLAAHLMMGISAPAALGIITADIVEISLTAAVFKHLDRIYEWYLSVRCIIILALTCLLASFLSTAFQFIWISVVVPLQQQPYIKARSVTEALDLLVALPLAASWTEKKLLARLTRRHAAQILSLTALTVTASYFLLASNTPFLFLVIPLLLLTTLSGGLLGSTAAVFGLSLVVQWFTFEDSGKMNLDLNTDFAKLLLVYHFFTVTALLSTVPLGVLLARLENSAERLRDAGVAANRARQEAEAARDKAETAGRAKGEFLSVMSHELRTPMTGVLGLVDLLSRENLPYNHKTQLESIKQSGRHLLRVINDILDFSKIDSGKLEIESTSFSIRSAFETVCATTRPLCDAKNVGFDSEFPDDAPEFVFGDPTRTQQILINLVGNAIKFTEEGSVRVTADYWEIDDNRLQFRFEVQDTGIGIAKEKQAEIFSAFTQEDKSTARRYGGSGLGLAICKRLVIAMDGEIDFVSSPEIGSTFWVKIPFLKCGFTNQSTGQENVSPDLYPRRILVAEDIELNRDIIRSMLSADGHILAFAQNGAEAVELANRGAFDLILMDIQMPVMDGVEAARRIRRLNGPVKDIPIIALTANVFESERKHYLEAGMNICIAKPIDWTVLNDAISQHTSGRRGPAIAGSELPSTRSEDSVLLDDSKLKALKGKLGPHLESLLRQAIDHAERTCGGLEGEGPVESIKAEDMHALKGMAGMLGLAAIQRLSEDIEMRLRADSHVEIHGSELREMILASRSALINHGFLSPVKTSS